MKDALEHDDHGEEEPGLMRGEEVDEAASWMVEQEMQRLVPA